MTYRNRKLLDIVRQSPCQICGVIDGSIVAAHSNQLRDGKGTGTKSADYRICALCYTCHMELDQGKSYTKQDRVEVFEDAHRKTIAWLFENNHVIIV